MRCLYKNDPWQAKRKEAQKLKEQEAQLNAYTKAKKVADDLYAGVGSVPYSGGGSGASTSGVDAQPKEDKAKKSAEDKAEKTAEEIAKMNYVTELQATQYQAVFDKMHSCDWESQQNITENFILTKRKQFFQDIEDKEQYDLIYFDAFGFPLQPELWSEAIFKKMYEALLPKGTLVTYACRSSIKNAMLSVGFSIEKLPGAPGKREMLRATKNVWFLL